MFRKMNFDVAMLFTIKLIITLSLHTAFSSNELNLTVEEINKLDNILTSKPTNITLVNDKALDFYLSNSIDNSTDNLDLSVFDIETQKKILSVAETKNNMAKAFLNETRRYEWTADDDVKIFNIKAVDLMRQSIYSTRYRLQDTRELRIKFSNDIPYNIAILYGTLMQLRLKLDNIYATLKKLSYDYKFIYYLTLYERCVVIHVDVIQMVERMFKLSETLRKTFGERDTEELISLKDQYNSP